MGRLDASYTAFVGAGFSRPGRFQADFRAEPQAAAGLCGTLAPSRCRIMKKNRMARYALKEAITKWKDHLAISARGWAPGDRIVHDATYGVKVNHMVQVRDQSRSPRSGDLKAEMRGAKEGSDVVHISFVCGSGGAHRAVAVDERDWGMQACVEPG